MGFIAPPHPETWLKVTPAGLFCEPGGFFIDPLRAVDRAVISHGHSDHARPGHKAVLATLETLAIMTARLGEGRAGGMQQALRYGEVINLNGVKLWLRPAGHVLGSAQIALEWQGSRVVVSGDYKRRADPSCAPFEVERCDVFITEATFALPVFRHPDAMGELARLLRSAALFRTNRKINAVSHSKKRRGAATAAVNDPLPLREKSHTNISHTHETRPRKNSRAPPEVMERAQRRDHR